MSSTWLNCSVSFCNLFFQSSDRRQYTALKWKFLLTLCKLFLSCRTGIQTRSFMHGRQMLCHRATSLPHSKTFLQWWVSLAGVIEASIAWNAQFSVVLSRGYLRILYFFLHSLSGPGDHGFNLVSRSLLCPSSACCLCFSKLYLDLEYLAGRQTSKQLSTFPACFLPFSFSLFLSFSPPLFFPGCELRVEVSHC